MTHEEVNKLEDVLRKAEENLEEAGRILCNEATPEANGIRGTILGMLGVISEDIHDCYKLRPWDD